MSSQLYIVYIITSSPRRHCGSVVVADDDPEVVVAGAGGEAGQVAGVHPVRGRDVGVAGASVHHPHTRAQSPWTGHCGLN